MELFFEAAIEEKMLIPKPLKHNEDYSLKVLLRMPKSIHATLSAAAKLEGVSLNQYILYRLAGNSKKASLMETAEMYKIPAVYIVYLVFVHEIFFNNSSFFDLNSSSVKIPCSFNCESFCMV